MPADCTLIKGTRLMYGSDGINFPNVLIDVVEIGPPGQRKRPKIDKTPLDPAGDREYALGLGDPGMQTFKQLWNRTRESTLQTMLGAPTTTYYWRILYPDSPSNTDANKSHSDFVGTLSGLTKEPLSDVDKRLVLDCEITITGTVTFTAGTGV